MHLCLTPSIIRYGSRVKWRNSVKGEGPLLHLGVVAIEKGVFGSTSTTVANFTYNGCYATKQPTNQPALPLKSKIFYMPYKHRYSHFLWSPRRWGHMTHEEMKFAFQFSMLFHSTFFYPWFFDHSSSTKIIIISYEIFILFTLVTIVENLEMFAKMFFPSGIKR